MLAETELEALHCFDRNALEGLQIHSGYLRDLVNRHARSLPLRRIEWVNMTREYDTDYFHLAGEPYWLRLSEQNLFYRINNAFIHRLTFDFRPENLPRLNYLWTNGSDLQCKIRALAIEALDKPIGYALLDLIGVHLKPRVYEASNAGEHREDYVTLFAHSALRGNVRHLAYETIEMTERGTDVVRSVTLLYQHFDEVDPLRNVVAALGQPRRTHVPAPSLRQARLKQKKPQRPFTSSPAVGEQQGQRSGRAREWNSDTRSSSGRQAH